MPLNPFRIYTPPSAQRTLGDLPPAVRAEVQLYVENVATLASYTRPTELRRLYALDKGTFAGEAGGARVFFSIDHDLRTVYVKAVELGRGPAA